MAFINTANSLVVLYSSKVLARYTEIVGSKALGTALAAKQSNKYSHNRQKRISAGVLPTLLRTTSTLKIGQSLSNKCFKKHPKIFLHISLV